METEGCEAGLSLQGVARIYLDPLINQFFSFCDVHLDFVYAVRHCPRLNRGYKHKRTKECRRPPVLYNDNVPSWHTDRRVITLSDSS